MELWGICSATSQLGQQQQQQSEVVTFIVKKEKSGVWSTYSSDTGVKCANVRANASKSSVKYVREGIDCFILSPMYRIMLLQ